jgi:hypothetical protein
MGGGGGGGAGGVGGNGIWKNGNMKASGDGGSGSLSSITGSSLFYAGGGGGGVTLYFTDPGPWGGVGGSGIGGRGGWMQVFPTVNYPPTNGAQSTGSGGGGGGARSEETGQDGAAGGSGIVVIAYPDTFAAPKSIDAGLSYDQPSRSGYRVYRFTAGTGIITF